MKLDLNFDGGVVRDFALDVWEDLKETGLAGIAVGMALAFVAISAIVLRPSGPPQIETGYAAATAAPTEQVAIKVPGEKPLEMADLDLSAPRDPFQDVNALKGGTTENELPADSKSIEEMTVAATEASSDGGGSSDGGEDALVPLDELETASTDVETADPVAPEDPAPEGDPRGRTQPEDDAPASPATDYAYAVDVQFGQVGSLKRYSQVQRLSFVPGRSNPLLMYLGVKADRETAVFMVDSRLSQGGEGTCVPKPTLCTFLEVSDRPDRDEHRFRDADGNEYLLRVRGVTRMAASAGMVRGADEALPGTPQVLDGSR